MSNGFEFDTAEYPFGLCAHCKCDVVGDNSAHVLMFDPNDENTWFTFCDECFQLAQRNTTGRERRRAERARRFGSS